MENDVVFGDECYKIVGVCFEVHNKKGGGFLKSVYQECLEIELAHQHVLFAAQQPLPLFCRGRELKQKTVPDFICFGKIIIEIKATKRLLDEHRAQVINYLSASNFQFGILVNFGSHPKLEWERFIHTPRNF